MMYTWSEPVPLRRKAEKRYWMFFNNFHYYGPPWAFLYLYYGILWNLGANHARFFLFLSRNLVSSDSVSTLHSL